jgi:hypothetical protein
MPYPENHTPAGVRRKQVEEQSIRDCQRIRKKYVEGLMQFVLDVNAGTF